MPPHTLCQTPQSVNLLTTANTNNNRMTSVPLLHLEDALHPSACTLPHFHLPIPASIVNMNSNCACPEGTVDTRNVAIITLAMGMLSLVFTCTRNQRLIQRLEARVERIAARLRSRETNDQAQFIGELDEPIVDGHQGERGGSAREHGAGDSGFPGLE